MAPGKTWFLVFTTSETSSTVNASFKVVYSKELGVGKIDLKTLQVKRGALNTERDFELFNAWKEANLSSISLDHEALEKAALPLDIPGGGVFFGCVRNYKYY